MESSDPRTGNLGYWCAGSVERFPEKTALIDLSGDAPREITYRALDERLDRVAATLVRLSALLSLHRERGRLFGSGGVAGSRLADSCDGDDDGEQPDDRCGDGRGGAAANGECCPARGCPERGGDVNPGAIEANGYGR